MAVAAKSAVTDQRGEISSLDLADEASAAVLINPDAGEILAANAGGAAALGLFSYASFPIALDPAMPAVARLRQIASMAHSGKGSEETLLFWKSGRLRRVKCKVSQRGGKGAGGKVSGAKGSKILLLHILSVEAADDASRQPKRIAPPVGAPAVAPVQAASAKTPVSAAHVAAPISATPMSAIPIAALDGETLAKLAHELKTPLTAIAAAAEIMRDERLGEMKNARYLTYAADIHESATHALDVITSMLAERARPAPAPSRLIAIDLNAIVERTVSSLKALAESCELSLSFDSGERRPHVVANPTALRQILLNLLTNAIKYTPRGGKVSVATGHIQDGRVFLTVRDTGRGMGHGMDGAADAVAAPASAADLQPVWATSTGIGLPLVATLVQDIGAEIEIDSAPQKGTAATILFGDFTRRFK